MNVRKYVEQRRSERTSRTFAVSSCIICRRVLITHVAAYMCGLEIDLCTEHTQVTGNSHSFVKLTVSSSAHFLGDLGLKHICMYKYVQHVSILHMASVDPTIAISILCGVN